MFNVLVAKVQFGIDSVTVCRRTSDSQSSRVFRFQTLAENDFIWDHNAV